MGTWAVRFGSKKGAGGLPPPTENCVSLLSTWAKGKSGAVRVCYVYFEKFGIVLLVIAYGKTEAADLSPAQKKALRQLIERQEREWSRRRG